MSFPVLQASKAFARVVIREGRGATGWNGLDPVYDGPCDANDKWDGPEGTKLAARHCLFPSDPESTLSQPYTVAGVEGLDVGEPERLRFPSGS